MVNSEETSRGCGVCDSAATGRIGLRAASAGACRRDGILHQRQEEWQEKWGEPPTPLLQDVRVLILRTCPPDKAPDLRMVFAKQPFGETVLYAVRTSSLQAQLDNGANVLF